MAKKYVKMTSVIFSKFQTTIPKGVRDVLGIKEKDILLYTPHENGGYLITKMEEGYDICPCCKGTGRCKTKKE